MHILKKIKFNCIRTEFATFLLIRDSRESQVYFLFINFISLYRRLL